MKVRSDRAAMSIATGNEGCQEAACSELDLNPSSEETGMRVNEQTHMRYYMLSQPVMLASVPVHHLCFTLKLCEQAQQPKALVQRA